MWIQLNSTVRHTLIGALYHPPKPKYKPSTLLDFIATNISTIKQLFPSALVVLAGDFNRLSDDDIVSRSCLQQLVRQPTCGARTLDKIYVSEPSYSTVEVVEPRMKSDHKAVIAYNSDHQWYSLSGPATAATFGSHCMMTCLAASFSGLCHDFWSFVVAFAWLHLLVIEHSLFRPPMNLILGSFCYDMKLLLRLLCGSCS